MLIDYETITVNHRGRLVVAYREKGTREYETLRELEIRLHRGRDVIQKTIDAGRPLSAYSRSLLIIGGPMNGQWIIPSKIAAALQVGHRWLKQHIDGHIFNWVEPTEEERQKQRTMERWHKTKHKPKPMDADRARAQAIRTLLL